VKAIETSQLTKYYGKNRGILNLNLEVEEGDVFGFIGPNGAGKSTTIRTLLNFLFPSGGSARVFGLDIVRDSKEIRKIIGYVPSEVNYYGDMTVMELLRYSASFYPNCPAARANELVERFELNPGRKFGELSHGNKKKVAIIQALLHKPRLLILDEPTSGLDPVMQNVFFDLLREENQRATIFFSSHVLSEVQKMCNRIAIIKQGMVLKVERIDDLRKRQFKSVTVEFAEPDAVLEIEGMIKTEKWGNVQKFFFNGEMKNLLYALSHHDVHNVLIEEPSLEEIFMHCYENTLETADAR